MSQMNTSIILCRICGCSQLDKHHFTLDQLCNKVGLYQILTKQVSLNKLIRPCNCKGEFSHAHKLCLEDWIETTKHRYCDICRFKYIITLYNQTFFDWIFETQQIKVLLKVFVCALFVYYLSVLGILVCQEDRIRGFLGIFVYSTSCIWITVCSIGLLIYMYQSTKQFQRWKMTNQRVRVDENNDPQIDVQVPAKDILKASGLIKAAKRD